jgi:hypothetical protein
VGVKGRGDCAVASGRAQLGQLIEGSQTVRVGLDAFAIRSAIIVDDWVLAISKLKRVPTANSALRAITE